MEKTQTYTTNKEGKQKHELPKSILLVFSCCNQRWTSRRDYSWHEFLKPPSQVQELNMKEFLEELAELCNKHKVALVWGLNSIRVVSVYGTEKLERKEVMHRINMEVDSGVVDYRKT